MFRQIAEVIISKPEALPDPSGETIASGVLDLVFIAVASISTIVMVIQGIRYTLSFGEPEKTAKAKNGIIYSLVGVLIATTAWSLLNFTLEKVIRDTSAVEETVTITNLIGDIAGFIIFIGAIISVIVIFIAAIKLNVSGGNPKEAKKARDMIIYALVGLILTASAGPILVFVLDHLGRRLG